MKKMQNSKKITMYSARQVEKVCLELLLKTGVRRDIAKEVTNCLVETSFRGVDSHGINLLPHYLNAVLAGRINPNPNFKFKKTSATTGLLDADDSFGHAAGSLAIKKAIEMSKVSGSGFVGVYNSTHFSACSYYSLQAARENMIGIALTHTDSLMLSARGKRPFLGTNLISFTFPCEGEDPVCLDMATTQVTFNYVRMAMQNSQKLKRGLAVDKNATDTIDPEKAAALLPIGDYKGYGLAIVIEIFCSLLTNMSYGPDIVSMFKAPISEKRKLGHFFGAINIGNFVEISVFKKRLKEFITRLRNEPALNPNFPVLVPGDPEKKTQEFRLKHGIPLAEQTVKKINDFIAEYNLPKQFILRRQ